MTGGGAAAAGVCIQRRGLTVEGEVAKQCGDHVQHEAEADADVGNILHPPFSRPERKEQHGERAAGERLKAKLGDGRAHRSSSQ